MSTEIMNLVVDVDFERDVQSTIIIYVTGFQVHCHLISGTPFCFCHNLVYLVSLEVNWNDTVVETVVMENIRETRRDDDPNPIIQESPWSMLTGGTAAKIWSCYKDSSVLIFWHIQDKVGIGSSVFVETPSGKQERAKASAFDAL